MRRCIVMDKEIEMSQEGDLFRPSDDRVRRVVERLRTAELCDHCLGRLVGRIGHGYSNDQRGALIRQEYGIQELSGADECRVCRGLFRRLDRMASAVCGALSELDFESFAVGSRYDPAVLEREEGLWAEVGGEHSEPMKAEMNREVGKRVERLIGKTVDTQRPDVTAILDVNFLQVQLEIAPMFIYGRYRKFDRSIPQTKWPCRRCSGKGCERCGLTGKIYQESVEELVRGEFMRASGAEETAFHGMGREDIDAVMLGNGRPFVLELRSPRIRSLDLERLAERTNEANAGRVEILSLRPSSKEEVRRIKGASMDKSYRVVVRLGAEVDYAKLKKVLDLLTGHPIEQRTPNRVSHRRADKLREREIVGAELEELTGQSATVRVRASAGTYIKELMHGDQGRTSPSLAGLLETDVEVVQLDVIEIHDEGDHDGESIKGE